MSLNPLSKLGHVRHWRERSQWAAGMCIGGSTHYGPRRGSRSAAGDDLRDLQALETRDDVQRVAKEMQCGDGMDDRSVHSARQHRRHPFVCTSGRPLARFAGGSYSAQSQCMPTERTHTCTSGTTACGGTVGAIDEVRSRLASGFRLCGGCHRFIIPFES